MSGNQQSILPLHYTRTGSDAALPVGFQEARTPSVTQSVVLSATPSVVPSTDPPTSVPSAAVPEPHFSPPPDGPTSYTCSKPAPAANPPSTACSAASETASETSSQTSSTPSNDTDPPVPAGYPKLATRMGDIPEQAIFRRFGYLNAQILLYMQAELVNLEAKLRKIQAKDHKAPGSRSLYAKNWFFLGNSEYQDDGDERQWELVKEIREKLKEYNEMLIQQLKIVSVSPPGAYDLRHIQRYLVCKDMENGALTGRDSGIWGSCVGAKPKEPASDLLALLGRHNEDLFSTWVAESVVDKLPQLQQSRESSRMLGFRMLSFHELTDRKVLNWTFMFASVLASALPILSIVILYWVHSIKVRLGLIAVFNVVLSFVLAGFTSAKRAEVFAVSAAFSAICVVFVQVGTGDSQVASN